FFLSCTLLPTPQLYLPSLHDALPILCATTEHIAVALRDVHVIKHRDGQSLAAIRPGVAGVFAYIQSPVVRAVNSAFRFRRHHQRSEEHTSELQSPDHPVCRLLLEKQK